MKRVLFARRTYEFGGAEVIVLDWLKRIDYSRYEVFVCSPADVFSQRIADSGLRAKFVHLSESEVTHIYGRYRPKEGINDLVKGSFWHFFPIWLRFLWRIKPDAVVFQDGDFFCTPLACVLAAFVVTGGNVSMTIHSPNKLQEPSQKTTRYHFGLPDVTWWYRRVWWPLLPWRLRQRFVRRVFTVSQIMADRVVDFYGYPRSKMALVNHGVDTVKFQPSPSRRIRWRREHNIPDDALMIISTCRLSREKNVDLVVKAFETIAPSNPGIVLVIAGDGPLRQDVETLVGACSAKGRIRLLGHVDDVVPLLQTADVYVLASSFEGRSIAMMEAMAVGLTCLISRVPGSDEVIEDGRNGFLVEPCREGVLTALERVISLPAIERSRLGRCARERILEKHELNPGIDSYLAELEIEVAQPITDPHRASETQEAQDIVR